MTPIVVAAWLAIVTSAQATRTEHLEARPADGRIVVNVYKAGLFSAFAHDHHFEVSEWRATAAVPEGDPSATSVDVVLSAGSLRDAQRGLSDGDRRKIDAQAAGPNVLDASHHPRIEFRSERIRAHPISWRRDHARARHDPRSAHASRPVRSHERPVRCGASLGGVACAWHRPREAIRLRHQAVQRLRGDGPREGRDERRDLADAPVESGLMARPSFERKPGRCGAVPAGPAPPGQTSATQRADPASNPAALASTIFPATPPASSSSWDRRTARRGRRTAIRGAIRREAKSASSTAKSSRKG